MTVFDPKTAIQIAIGLVIREENGRRLILTTQRPRGSHLGGLWEFPGGKVEPPESPQQALERELLEELGIRITAGAGLEPLEHAYEDRSVRLLPFWCPLQTPVTVEHLGVTDHRWIRPGELGGLEFPQANKPLILRLRNGLWPHT